MIIPDKFRFWKYINFNNMTKYIHELDNQNAILASLGYSNYNDYANT